MVWWSVEAVGGRPWSIEAVDKKVYLTRSTNIFNFYCVVIRIGLCLIILLSKKLSFNLSVKYISLTQFLISSSSRFYTRDPWPFMLGFLTSPSICLSPPTLSSTSFGRSPRTRTSWPRPIR